jgi:hypothetical protein
MFEEEQLPIFRKTLRGLILEIESIVDVPVDDFKESIIDCFEGYDYEEVEDLRGVETWTNIEQDGEYEIEVGINHQDAYLLTLHLTTTNSKVTVTNVL